MATRPLKKIYCISGKAQNGKDTLAGFMREFLIPYHSVLVIHYADLLKFICKTYFNWDGVKDEYGRHILQHVGTDIIRANDPNYWVRFVIQLLKLFSNEWEFVIIPDCRFPNEIEGLATLESWGYDIKSIRVERHTPGWKSPLPLEQQDHPSETALDEYPFDYIVENRADLDFLRSKAQELICVDMGKYVGKRIII